MEKKLRDMTRREKVDNFHPSDITAVFDFIAEGSMTREEAEKDLHRMTMNAIDYVTIEELRRAKKHKIVVSSGVANTAALVAERLASENKNRTKKVWN